MNPAVVSVAQLGCGYWGPNLLRNFHGLPNCRVTRVVEPSQERQTYLRANFPGLVIESDWAAALADPATDAVAIATPAVTHFDLVQRALRAGKHVFVEKPLALSAREGRELVALAAQVKRCLMVGHLLWYHPAILKLKELMDAGELGQLRYIYSHRLNLGKIRREENILWSFAPHDISVILGLAQEMPYRVEAQGGTYLRENIADVTVSTLAFPGGVRAHVFVSWLHPFKEQKLVVVGDRQMAVFNDLEEKNKLVLYPHQIGWNEQQPVVVKAAGTPLPLQWEEPLRAECRHFLECIQTGHTPRTDGAEGCRVLEVLEQCQRGLELGRSASPFQAPAGKGE